MYIGHQYLNRFKRRGNVVVCFLNDNYIMFFFKFYPFLLGSLARFQLFFINIKNDLIIDFKNPRKAHFILTLNFSLVSVP